MNRKLLIADSLASIVFEIVTEECVNTPTMFKPFQNNYYRLLFHARIEDLPCLEQSQTLANFGIKWAITSSNDDIVYIFQAIGIL